MVGFRRRLLAAFAITLLVSILRGQDIPASRPNTATPAFNERLVQPASISIPPVGHPTSGNEPITSTKIVQAAGIIFSGRVVSVERSLRGANDASTIVTFYVEHAIRGAISAQNLTIREWAGLWSRGERYRTGERVFLFLYPTSKLGFTSPVAGGAGRFAVDARDQIVMNTQAGFIFGGDPAINGKKIMPYADFAKEIEHIASQK
jgi:hypothetical protein